MEKEKFLNEVVFLVKNFKDSSGYNIMQTAKCLRVSYATVWKLLNGYTDFSENLLVKIDTRIKAIK